MKFNNSLLLSTVALALMATGCVKKQDNVTASGTYDTSNESSTTIYDTTGTTTTTDTTTGNYETAGPLVYDSGSGVVDSGTTYSEVIPDNTVVTTGTTVNYGTGEGEIVDNYNDTQSSGAFSTNSSGESSTYAYGGYSGTDYSSSPAPSYSSTSTTSSSSSSQSGGIHLQVAALKDYYAAEEFKKSLSLDPKYSVYIKRGALNKVIISGISSVNEANRLKERRFPGAFIVRNSGGSSSSSTYASSPSSNYNTNNSYTDNSAYGNSYSSSTSHSSTASSSSVGVQIGAFSSRGKAQSIANSNSGRYKAIVQQGTSRGRSVYRVILTGFSSRSDAKRALASGRIANGFVTTVH